MDKVTFGKRVCDLRKSLKIKSKEMSLDLGQQSEYISRIENGKYYPSMDSFFKICEYLDVKPDDFFKNGEIQSKEVIRLSRILKQLNPNQLKVIDLMAQELAKKNR